MSGRLNLRFQLERASSFWMAESAFLRAVAVMLNAAHVEACQVTFEASAPQCVCFLEIFTVDCMIEVVLCHPPDVGP